MNLPELFDLNTQKITPRAARQRKRQVFGQHLKRVMKKEQYSRFNIIIQSWQNLSKHTTFSIIPLFYKLRDLFFEIEFHGSFGGLILSYEEYVPKRFVKDYRKAMFQRDRRIVPLVELCLKKLADSIEFYSIEEIKKTMLNLKFTLDLREFVFFRYFDEENLCDFEKSREIWSKLPIVAKQILCFDQKSFLEISKFFQMNSKEMENLLKINQVWILGVPEAVLEDKALGHDNREQFEEGPRRRTQKVEKDEKVKETEKDEKETEKPKKIKKRLKKIKKKIVKIEEDKEEENTEHILLPPETESKPKNITEKEFKPKKSSQIKKIDFLNVFFDEDSDSDLNLNQQNLLKEEIEEDEIALIEKTHKDRDFVLQQRTIDMTQEKYRRGPALFAPKSELLKTIGPCIRPEPWICAFCSHYNNAVATFCAKCRVSVSAPSNTNNLNNEHELNNDEFDYQEKEFEESINEPKIISQSIINKKKVKNQDVTYDFFNIPIQEGPFLPDSDEEDDFHHGSDFFQPGQESGLNHDQMNQDNQRDQVDQSFMDNFHPDDFVPDVIEGDSALGSAFISQNPPRIMDLEPAGEDAIKEYDLLNQKIDENKIQSSETSSSESDDENEAEYQEWRQSLKRHALNRNNNQSLTQNTQTLSNNNNESHSNQNQNNNININNNNQNNQNNRQIIISNENVEIPQQNESDKLKNEGEIIAFALRNRKNRKKHLKNKNDLSVLNDKCDEKDKENDFKLDDLVFDKTLISVFLPWNCICGCLNDPKSFKCVKCNSKTNAPKNLEPLKSGKIKSYDKKRRKGVLYLNQNTHHSKTATFIRFHLWTSDFLVNNGEDVFYRLKDTEQGPVAYQIMSKQSFRQRLIGDCVKFDKFKNFGWIRIPSTGGREKPDIFFFGSDFTKECEPEQGQRLSFIIDLTYKEPRALFVRLLFGNNRRRTYEIIENVPNHNHNNNNNDSNIKEHKTQTFWHDLMHNHKNTTYLGIIIQWEKGHGIIKPDNGADNVLIDAKTSWTHSRSFKVDDCIRFSVNFSTLNQIGYVSVRAAIRVNPIETFDGIIVKYDRGKGYGFISMNVRWKEDNIYFNHKHMISPLNKLDQYKLVKFELNVFCDRFHARQVEVVDENHVDYSKMSGLLIDRLYIKENKSRYNQKESNNSNTLYKNKRIYVKRNSTNKNGASFRGNVDRFNNKKPFK